MPVMMRANRQSREPNAAMTTSSDRLSLRGKVAIVTGGREGLCRGVRVNAVAPTFAKTDLTQKLLADAQMERAIMDLTPMYRLAEPHEVADAIFYLCSVMASMVTGQILAVDGGCAVR